MFNALLAANTALQTLAKRRPNAARLTATTATESFADHTIDIVIYVCSNRPEQLEQMQVTTAEQLHTANPSST
jgi:hypothetical protein